MSVSLARILRSTCPRLQGETYLWSAGSGIAIALVVDGRVRYLIVLDREGSLGQLELADITGTKIGPLWGSSVR